MTKPAVYVTLGSNINPFENIKRAVQLLREQCEVLAVSAVYRTPPQEFTAQADFLNACVKLHTDQTPLDFKLKVLRNIEVQLKRQRDSNNPAAPRTIDLDITLWGDGVLEYGDKPWHVPDEDILKYAYVALPLANLWPTGVHPITGQTYATIAAELDQTGIEALDLNLNDV